MLVCFMIWGCQPTQKKEEASKEVDTKAVSLNDIALADLSGNPIKISDYAGKVVFLNFWSTWCKPCIKEMPSIERAMNQLSDKGVVFLAASDESVEKIEKFKAKYDFTFQYIQLKDDYAALDVYSLPTTLIYDRKGEVVLNESGAREWDADDMIEKIEQPLKL